MTLNVEFLEGWGGGGGSISKTFRGRGMDIFWNNTLSLRLSFIHPILKKRNKVFIFMLLMML